MKLSKENDPVALGTPVQSTEVEALKSSLSVIRLCLLKGE